MKTNLLIAIALVAGCGTDATKPPGPEVLPDLMVPAKPTNGLQIITPIVEDIQPSSDNEICTWTEAITDKVTDVKSTLAEWNEPPGHHAVVFYTTVQLPAGTQRVCTDTDMATFRLLSGGAAPGVLNEAPGNLVYRLPAGAQIVIQHHYLNATDQVLRGQSVVNINFADPGNYIPSGNMAIVNTNLDVATGTSTQKMHCDFDRTMKLWYLIPHEHRWGTNEKIDLTIGGVKQRMFDTNWDPSFTFHPPEKRMDPQAPLIVNPGDSVDVECSWNNDSGHDLTFGFEMCVAFGQFVDDGAVGSRACDAGSWVTF